LDTKKLSCACTGHRKISESKIGKVRCRLRGEILVAIIDGYTNFLSGFAKGTDLEFVKLILMVKEVMPQITLEAVIPYRDRLNAKEPDFQELLSKCDKVTVISEEKKRNCYTLRNKYLIENADRIIAVFDGRKRGGTSQTIRMAEKNKKNIRLINI